MSERLKPSVKKKCSNCVHGDQIVALIYGGSVDDDGNEERWHTTEPRPIGQRRDCFTWLEKWWYEPNRFIYPGHDDSCVNLKKFQPKTLAIAEKKPRIK